jgi:hypothetical protein
MVFSVLCQRKKEGAVDITAPLNWCVQEKMPRLTNEYFHLTQYIVLSHWHLNVFTSCAVPITPGIPFSNIIHCFSSSANDSFSDETL